MYILFLAEVYYIHTKIRNIPTNQQPYVSHVFVFRVYRILFKTVNFETCIVFHAQPGFLGGGVLSYSVLSMFLSFYFVWAFCGFFFFTATCSDVMYVNLPISFPLDTPWTILTNR